MTKTDFTPNRLFTIEQANAMLPLVSAIVRDWSKLSLDVLDRQERLAGLKDQTTGRAPEIYRQEVELIRQELAQDNQRLLDFEAELRDLGVNPSSGPDGVVDFPSLIGDRVVNLCWRLGEEAVQHWHDTESGYSTRQILPLSKLRMHDADRSN